MLDSWNDNWFGLGYKLDSYRSNRSIGLHTCKVKDMVNERGNWDWNKLAGLLDPPVISKLQAFPPPLPDSEPDAMVWPGEVFGAFSIRSAYKFIQKDFAVYDSRGWNKIWKQRVPERIRTFTWIVLHGRLLTNQKRSNWTGSDPTCKECGAHIETILHVLRDCPMAIQVWSRLVPNQFKALFFMIPGKEWCLANLVRKHQWPKEWAITCWYLWNWRNKSVFEDSYIRPSDPAKVIEGWKTLSGQARNNRSLYPSTTDRNNAVWSPPTRGWVKLNTDGTFHSGNRSAGCGGLLRDHEGFWIRGLSRRLDCTGVLEVEACEVLKGLQLAWH